jgi:adenylate kinase family enzyme
MIISFIGPPGCGKSTQIGFVADTFLQDVGVIILRVPNLVKKHPDLLPYLTDEELGRIEELTQASFECRDNGKLSPMELDEILFDVAERCVNDKKFVILDGAPRGLEQAISYSNRKKLLALTVLIHLAFQDKAFENSVSRQFYRESLNRGFQIATSKLQRFCNKYETYNTDTKRGFELLKENHVPFVEIDALLSKKDVRDRVEKFMTKQLMRQLVEI